MKKISAIGLLIFLCAFTSQAQEAYSNRKQELYSNKYLEQTSHDSLNYLLQKAHKLKKTGGTIVIAGLAVTLVGAAFIAGDTETGFYTGGMFVIGGLLTTVVGLPILATGSARVNRVKDVLMTHAGASLNVSPCFVYNNSHNRIPCIAIKIRF
ncbi:MAG: hypothetical protein WCL00_11205 [Bacteroidota bacterium]